VASRKIGAKQIPRLSMRHPFGTRRMRIKVGYSAIVKTRDIRLWLGMLPGHIDHQFANYRLTGERDHLGGDDALR